MTTGVLFKIVHLGISWSLEVPRPSPYPHGDPQSHPNLFTGEAGSLPSTERLPGL